MDTKDLGYWLALQQVPEVGPVTFVRLLERLGSPQDVFEAAGKGKLPPIEGVRSSVLESLSKFRFDATNLERQTQVLEQQQVRVISYRDDLYPGQLKQISDFPPLIYIQGQVELLRKTSWLGVVGSRQATPYGLSACQKLVTDLSKQGIGVISGFARGIDLVAHMTAVREKGTTIAVLGGGLKHIHPSSHRRYVEEVKARGLLLSEFPYEAEPLPQYFPRRNRIISGLSRGVLVVEADEKSGAMITAQNALDQNRDLFAVPGSMFSSKSKGCHRLLQQGAKLVSEAKDIFDEWEWTCTIKSTTHFSDPDEQLVHAACQEQSLTPDELILKTGMGADKVTMLLTKLELKGMLKNLPGRRYQAL